MTACSVPNKGLLQPCIRRIKSLTKMFTSFNVISRDFPISLFGEISSEIIVDRLTQRSGSELCICHLSSKVIDFLLSRAKSVS